MNTRKPLTVVLVASALLSAGACSRDAEPDQTAPGASQGNETPPAEALHQQEEWGASITDGQILEVLATVDAAEIEQARVALDKAQSPAVREFAKRMIDEHTASQQKVANLESTAGTPRSESAYSLNLKPKGAQVLQTLNASDGAAFDRAYMQSQIQQHEEVLKLLDKRLIPDARTDAMKQLVNEARMMVEHHLMEARRIQV